MWLAFKALSTGWKIGLVAFLLLVPIAFGGYMYYTGRSDGKAISAEVIAEYKGKVSSLNTALTIANGKTTEKIVPVYVDRVSTIKETVYRNNDVIKNAVPVQGNLSMGWVYAYNQSVKGEPIDFALASNANPSAFSDNAALQRAASNNGICLANAAQLNALSAWVQEVYLNGQKTSASDVK